MFKDKTIWLIGANSDIALSFVKLYGSSFGRIVLATRNPNKTRELLRNTALNNTEICYIDLTDINSINTFLAQKETPYGIIFFAGWSEYLDKCENNSQDNILNTIQVNYLNTVMFVEKISDAMRANSEGFICTLASAGEIRGKYSTRFYTSSKKAITSYFEGMMQKNEKFSIKTIIIKLGHVDTKMFKKSPHTKKTFLITSADKVADFLFKCIKKEKSMIKYQLPIWRVIAIVFRLLPLSIYNKLDL